MLEGRCRPSSTDYVGHGGLRGQYPRCKEIKGKGPPGMAHAKMTIRRDLHAMTFLKFGSVMMPVFVQPTLRV